MTTTTNSKTKVKTSTHHDELGKPSTAGSGETADNAMTDTTKESENQVAPNPSEHAPTPPARLLAATLVGAIVATPLAWLLSYGATLPFFLGTFFFALFGLIVGASVYRVASPKRPYGKFTVVFATTALVAYVFTFALVKESRDLPRDLAKKAIKKTADLGGRTPKEYRADVAKEVNQYLANAYPPGGPQGYIRWSLTNGKIARGNLPSVNAEIAGPQSDLAFAIRIVLTLALLAFGLGSQTLALYHPPKTNKKPDAIKT